MLKNEDLRAAAEAGVINREQQSALDARPPSRSAGRSLGAGADERVRLVHGFNDVLLSIGVALVATAFLSQWAPYRDAGIGWLVAGAVALWMVAEVVVGRHKASLPGVVAVMCIGLLVCLAAGHLAWDAGARAIVEGNNDLKQSLWNFPFAVWLAGTGAGGCAVVMYYLRFRLPFAWLLISYCLAQTIVLVLNYQLGFDRALPLINTAMLVMGLALFALAMKFDSSDPERITRRSDCGFWLHLAAAPFIVHPVITMLGGREAGTKGTIITVCVFALFSLLALVVDRRALLVSLLLYFGLAVGYLVSTSVGAESTHGAWTITLGLLGAFVILMGLGWHRLRGLILFPFNGAMWLKYLPPVQA